MTARGADRHTRTVALLKVVLPLAALALLSTLFLLSRAIDPDAAIPFADKEIQDRLRDQQVTGPFFAGTTASGDELTFEATKLTTPDGQVGANEAQDVRAVVTTTGGNRIVLQASRASFDVGADMAELRGGVGITTSTGYDLRTDAVRSEMSSLQIFAPGTVTGSGPVGDFEAGALQIDQAGGSGATRLLFTNGVKLVYRPKQETK